MFFYAFRERRTKFSKFAKDVFVKREQNPRNLQKYIRETLTKFPKLDGFLSVERKQNSMDLGKLLSLIHI